MNKQGETEDKQLPTPQGEDQIKRYSLKDKYQIKKIDTEKAETESMEKQRLKRKHCTLPLGGWG